MTAMLSKLLNFVNPDQANVSSSKPLGYKITHLYNGKYGLMDVKM